MRKSGLISYTRRGWSVRRSPACRRRSVEKHREGTDVVRALWCWKHDVSERGACACVNERCFT